MPCATCLDLKPKTLDEAAVGQNVIHFIDIPDLQYTSKKCPGCLLITDALSTRGIDCSDKKHVSKSLKLYLAVGKPLEVEYGGEAIWLELYSRPGDNANSRWQGLPDTIGAAPEVSQSSDSSASCALLQSWFQTCTTSHLLCKTVQDPLLPTRVLKIPDPSSSQAETVRLLETQGSYGKYAALSYCWGQGSIHRALMTTKATIERHKDGLPLASLPLTLQHAVIISRLLGLRYIWIDALCIIQDDSDDWAFEASRMCEVYANSAITIIACQSDGSSGGIYGKQSYHEYDTLQYLGRPVYVRSNIARDHEHDVLVQHRDIADIDPIHTRAWAFQEAILSNRAVYFTSRELRWECNTCRECQCGKMSRVFPPVLDFEEYSYEGFRIFRLADFFPARAPADAYERWSFLCQFYCSRVLSKEQDKLVALSGLARQFARLLELKFDEQATYLAGIWLNSLPNELLWYAQNPGIDNYITSHIKPQVWRAPSWSWASMDSAINKGFHQSMQSRVKVLSAATELSGDDPYGQIRSAYLNLDGPVLQGIRFIPAYDNGHGTRNRAGLFLSDEASTVHAIRYKECDLRITIAYVDKYSIGSREAHGLLCDQNKAFSILVVGYTASMDIHECLILLPVQGRPETFERVGIIRLGTHRREPKANAEAIESAPREIITLI